jgi:hypothetical protein
MVRMLAWMGEKLKAVLALFLPMYQKARASSGVSYWLRVALHLLIVAAILAGLFWLNYYSRWAGWIQSAVKTNGSCGYSGCPSSSCSFMHCVG